MTRVSEFEDLKRNSASAHVASTKQRSHFKLKNTRSYSAFDLATKSPSHHRTPKA